MSKFRLHFGLHSSFNLPGRANSVCWPSFCRIFRHACLHFLLLSVPLSSCWHLIDAWVPINIHNATTMMPQEHVMIDLVIIALVKLPYQQLEVTRRSIACFACLTLIWLSIFGSMMSAWLKDTRESTKTSGSPWRNLGTSQMINSVLFDHALTLGLCKILLLQMRSHGPLQRRYLHNLLPTIETAEEPLFRLRASYPLLCVCTTPELVNWLSLSSNISLAYPLWTGVTQLRSPSWVSGQIQLGHGPWTQKISHCGTEAQATVQKRRHAVKKHWLNHLGALQSSEQASIFNKIQNLATG